MTKQEMVDKIAKRDIFSEEAICSLLEYENKDDVICELIKVIGNIQEDFYSQLESMVKRVEEMEKRQSKIDYNITTTKNTVAEYISKKEAENNE
jgi:hypothetical protein